MPDTHQFALAEAATSAACAEYLMRSALESTHFTQRHQQLIDSVARRQLTPQQVDDALAVAADWSAVARDVSAAISAFAQSLAQHPLLPHEHATHSLDEVVSNGQRSADHHLVDADAFSALLLKLAQPDVTPGARRRALTRLNRSTANASIAGAATAWFTMLDAVGSATLRALNPALLTVLRTAQPVGYHGDVIELHGSIATHATTQLDVENTLGRPASLRCTCHEVRRADGIGPAFTPSLTLTPEFQQLDAREEGAVALSLWLDELQFEASATYVGAVSVEGDGGTALRIPLRITTTPAHP